MTGFQFFVTYVTCWWLVLFMVLPHQADAPKEPGLGHAPSAPANPQLKKKIKWTTLLAIIPAVALYFIVGAAKAEDMYHAGSGGCNPLTSYKSSGDVEARDGYSTGGKKVAPATMGGGSTIGNQDHFDIPLEMPTAKYLNKNAASGTAAGGTTTGSTTTGSTTSSGHNVDLSQSFVQMGRLRVDRDGGTSINGEAIAPQPVYPDGCEH